MPTISLVTPSFNSAPTIEHTFHSVISQNYANLEYIVMDGGSTDGTTDIIRKYQGYLSSWVSERDNGQYAAIKTGLSKSTGDVMGWLNADDMLLPGALETVAEVFATFPSVQWISTLAPGLWDAKGRLAGVQRIPGFSRRAFLDGLYLPGELTRGHWIQQESTFWRRGLWDKVVARAFSGVRLAGDFALWADFYENTELFGVEYPLAGFRLMEGQRSQNIEAYLSEGREVLSQLRRAAVGQERRSTFFTYGRGRNLLPLSDRLSIAVTSRLGYHGRKIVFSDKRNLKGNWSLIDYNFLP